MLSSMRFCFQSLTNNQSNNTLVYKLLYTILGWCEANLNHEYMNIQKSLVTRYRHMYMYFTFISHTPTSQPRHNTHILIFITCWDKQRVQLFSWSLTLAITTTCLTLTLPKPKPKPNITTKIQKNRTTNTHTFIICLCSIILRACLFAVFLNPLSVLKLKNE